MSEMTFEKMIRQMTPAIYASLKQAVELRKWPDGRRLSEAQLELCLEAVLKYEVEHEVPEASRVGYLERAGCASQQDGEDEIKWVN
ncbi:DUF1315 family protein [Halomonas pacifica]|uniref:DUF1315 family protein n=1 Tax=Bisbaumannia pacifica TaxID=77098 RepID=A0A510X962_9GAMM|nr:DUF1315 family protein [Halomonas pacifica]MBH8579908.1 DUF1315 family protein [Halomonas pacifica]MDC8803510.1 DUF1315 family protein [Halomonas pacifica]GEK47988.1 hypothetical protein HPA02_22710 [Halomonas pacifica]